MRPMSDRTPGATLVPESPDDNRRALGLQARCLHGGHRHGAGVQAGVDGFLARGGESADVRTFSGRSGEADRGEQGRWRAYTMEKRIDRTGTGLPAAPA